MKEKVIRWINEHKEQIINFCADLIKYKSTTNNEVHVQRDFLFPFLKENFQFKEIEIFSASKEHERPNIIAIAGEGSRARGRNLLFNGHVDVVDVPKSQLSRWKVEPWSPKIVDNKIYGRGASDMKGGITAMLWAVKAVQETNIQLEGNVGIELVVGEETMEHEIGTTAATKRLLERGFNFDVCIDPEPTACEIHTMSCGTFDFEVQVVGREIHTANRNLLLYPQRWGISCGKEVAVDAISKIMEVIEVLRKLEREYSMRWRHPILGGGGHPIHEDLQGVGSTFTLNVSFIEGGTYISSVPGDAKIICQCYYPPWVRYENVVNMIKEAIENYSKIDSWLRENPPKLSFGKRFHWPPYETPIDHPACKMLGEAWEKVTSRKAVYSGFKAVNDLTFIQAFGIPGISFGPGDLSMGAHGPNEHVPIDQLIECTKTLALFIAEWCAGR